jgi:hypothetical protein
MATIRSLLPTPISPGFAGTGWDPTQSGAYLIKVEYEAVDQNMDSSGTVGSPSPGASASTASSPAASKRVRGGDYQRLDVFAERHLENDGRLEHPWDWRPEFAQRGTQRMHHRVGHRVRAELLEPARCLRARQAG